MKNKIKFGKIETKYKGKIFAFKQREVTLPNGDKKIFEYCERPSTVSILAFNEKGEILMIREKRAEKSNKLSWYLPGGRMDGPGEAPKKAALRELREETGYAAKKFKLIHKKSPSATLIWDIYVFAARDLYLSPLPPDPSEVITPVFVPFKKAVQMALDGTIDNEFISYNIIRFDYMIKNKQFVWKI